MRDDRTRYRTLALSLVLAVALIAAACGSSSKSSTAAKSSAANSSATTAGAAANAISAAAPSNTVWLCRPGVSPDPCAGDLDTTSVSADGTTNVTKVEVAKNPPIDCFYVYPTVSQQQTIGADLTIDPAETGVAIAQTAPFSQVCKVYAPMYRQLTLKAIGGGASGDRAQAAANAYADVQNAWLDYLAHDNHGRGVVLIGHSQGAGVLTQLIKKQVDTNPAARKLLVSAILLGGNVLVPVGKDVGGSFTQVPACHSDSQTGCVVAYSSFLVPPPAGSFFGRSRTAGDEVLCTNPAALAGGSASIRPLFPTKQAGGVFSLVTPGTTVSTPWVSYPGLYKAECMDTGGASWLQITPTPAAGDTRPVVTQQIGPNWGLHLVDVNIDFGDLVALVRHQTSSYKG